MLLGLGLFTHVQMGKSAGAISSLSTVAIDIYDKAFEGVDYAHKAQTGFVRYEHEHCTPNSSFTDDASHKDAQKILDNLDVVIDRATSDKSREAAKALRAEIEVLSKLQTNAAAPDLGKIDKDAEKLVARLGAEGFAYRNKELVLDGLDFIGEPEKTTALVGPSGGGKSTILALIQRFYDPCRGRIAIDGVDVRRVDIASLRRKIAFVSQDVFLFHASIAANIGLGRPGASQADIVAAARQANAHDFIMSFAAGYATPVGEHGLHLSAGQRQRIAIARAILKQAPILLLDEPTAALDPESEQAIQVALEDLRRGRTTIVVAHRLQTIVAADRITMIEAGRAVEAGTHAELIAGGGKYMRFFQSQFELAEGPPAVVI